MLRSETEGDPARMEAALNGLRAYQAAERPERTGERPVFATAGRARLLDCGEGNGNGKPVLFVPSLINTPDVLDLLPDVSFMGWLAARGFRPLLLDWGTPSPAEADLDIGGHVETLLLPLMDAAGPEAALVGYCLGGTMAMAAAALRPVAGLAMIAAPWRFSGFPDDARAGIASLWQEVRPTVEKMGLLPVEVLQAAFWRLDPRRSIDKFVAFGRSARDAESTRLFVALEDWANSGAPLTLAAGRELIETLFRDDTPGRSEWHVAGQRIDPAALTCPILNIVSSSDRIVPAASAVEIGERRTVSQGHVGMVVGGRRIETLWQPLADWLANPHMGDQDQNRS